MGSLLSSMAVFVLPCDRKLQRAYGALRNGSWSVRSLVPTRNTRPVSEEVSGGLGLRFELSGVELWLGTSCYVI